MRDEFTTPVRGAAYSRVHRGAATLVSVAVVAMGIATLLRGVDSIGVNTWLWFALALLVLAATYALMMRARTTIDAVGIRQSGVIERRVDWTDVQNTRMTRWGLSRRLIVRSSFGQFRVFLAGTPELVAAFERIAARYPARAAT